MKLDIDRHILSELWENTRKIDKSRAITYREIAKMNAYYERNHALLSHLVKEGGVDEPIPSNNGDTREVHTGQETTETSSE